MEQVCKLCGKPMVFGEDAVDMYNNGECVHPTCADQFQRHLNQQAQMEHELRIYDDWLYGEQDR
jgi:hypothetical protein